MNPKVKTLIDEIVHLADHLKRVSEESRGYITSAKINDALRVHGTGRDSIGQLVKKWDELHQLLNVR